MTSGIDFFADADYDDLEVQQPRDWNLPAGTHEVTVSDAGQKDTKDGRTLFIVKFTNDEGQSYTEWFEPITEADKEFAVSNTTRAEIKRQQRVNVLCSLGVPRDRLSQLDPESLIGIEGTLVISPGKKYQDKQTQEWKEGRLKFRKFTLKETALQATGPITSQVNGTSALDGISEFAKQKPVNPEFGF